MLRRLLCTFSWQELRHHPWRSAAAVGAVMLGVALAFAVHLINASALDEFQGAVRSVNGQGDVEIRAAQGGFDEALYGQVAALPQVALASPVLEADVMLRTNVNQAEIACRAAKGTFYEAIGAAIKIGAMVPTTDLKIIQQSTTPGYDAAVIQVKMHWKKLFGRGKLGVMAAVGGLVLAITEKASPVLHIIVAVMIAIAALWVRLFPALAQRDRLVEPRA